MPVASDLENGLSSDKGRETIEEQSDQFQERIYPADVLTISAD